jgi:hypothetical protein
MVQSIAIATTEDPQCAVIRAMIFAYQAQIAILNSMLAALNC